MIDPTQPDPNFPNRPTHPDFAELSTLIQQMDDPDYDVEDALKFIDEESLVYYVSERLPTLMGLARAQNVRPQDFMLALYIEAISVGYHLSQRRRETE